MRNWLWIFSTDINYQQKLRHSAEHLYLCPSEERPSLRSGRTWRWVNELFRVLFCLLSGSFLTKHGPYWIKCVHKYRFVIPGFPVYFSRCSGSALPSLAIQLLWFGFPNTPLMYRHIVFPDVAPTRCPESGFSTTVLCRRAPDWIWKQ